MSKAFSRYSVEPSCNRCCWFLSWLMPQTNLPLNISFNKFLYSQYSVYFLNSATNIEMLSSVFLTDELNLKHLAIIFRCGVWWNNINCFSSSKYFSPSFDRAANPLNNLYISIPHKLRSFAFLCDSSKILFASKKL